MDNKLATKSSTEDESSDTESDTSTDEIRYQCAALGLCKHYKKGQKSSNWLKKGPKKISM